jgi:hypothetical protein
MTGRNPNVFYEAGYAHAKDKLCTLLTQSTDDIPFDLKHHRHIVYDGSIQTLKAKLKPEIEWLKAEAAKQKTQPFTIELRSAEGELTKTDWSDVSAVEIIFDIKNKTKRRSPDIDAIYIYTKDEWTLEQDGKDCAHIPMDDSPSSRRHFVNPPISRLAPNAWGQIRVVAKKTVWTSWSGKERKTTYTHSGNLKVEISTSEGVFSQNIDPNVEVTEVPF